MSYNNMDTNGKGMYAEYLFASECIKRGIYPSKPLMDSSIYDMILEKDGKLYKVQIKYSAKVPSDRKSIQVPLCNGVKSRYDIDSVDFFVVYLEYFKGFFIIKNTGDMQGIRLNTREDSKYSYNFNNFNLNEIIKS